MISQHVKTCTKPPLKTLIRRFLHTKPAGPGHTTTTKPLTQGSLLSFQAFPLPSVLSADLCRQLNQHLRPWTLAEGASPSPTPGCSSIPVMRGHAYAARSRTHTCTTPATSGCLQPVQPPKHEKQNTKPPRRQIFRSAWSVGAGHLNLICSLERTFAKIHSTQEGSLEVPSHCRDMAIYGWLDGQQWQDPGIQTRAAGLAKEKKAEERMIQTLERERSGETNSH